MAPNGREPPAPGIPRGDRTGHYRKLPVVITTQEADPTAVRPGSRPVNRLVVVV